MSLNSILYTLASVPMFASRPFLAAWLTCVLAKFGTSIPFLGSSDVVETLARAPEWFRSGWMLAVLTALAALEVVAAKRPEVREWLDTIDGWVKSGVAMLVSLAVLDRDTASTIERIHSQGFGVENLGTAITGGLTFAASSLRQRVFEWLAHIDDDDDIGLQSVLSWVENSWTVLGILFLVVFPVVALVLSALTTLALFAWERRARKRELASRVACTTCSEKILPHATRCHACGTANASMRAVGVFGNPKDGPAESLERQRFDLVARKRCPLCATRLKKRAVQQSCPQCRAVTFASREDFDLYLASLNRRLPRTLLVCFALSAIPLAGVVPGVLYYRLTLVSGLRGYVPPLRGCLTRVVVRLVNFGLIALQPIPIAGAFVLPLMCLATFFIYRSALADRAEEDLAELAPANA